MQAHGKVDEDGSRYLLGDHLGNLLLLVLQHDGAAVLGLKTEPLGAISAPSTISYLDNGVVYIGSSFGDSQLVLSQLPLASLETRPVIIVSSGMSCVGTYRNVLRLNLCENLMSLVVLICEQPVQSACLLAAQGAFRVWA